MGAWFENQNGEKFMIERAVSIGRAPQNAIRIEGTMVSRRHALVHLQGDHEFWVVDLGSSNGTYVNGRRIQQPCQIKNGDSVQVGEHNFSFFQKMETSGGSGPSDDLGQTITHVRNQDTWMLIADIMGFTTLSQTVPGEELPKMVGAWLADCKQIIEDHGGIINKYLGDGFFAYWPAEDDTPVRLSVAMNALFERQKQDKPPFRLVLHFGRVTYGGASAGGEENLMGKELNFAFRMEKVASGLKAPTIFSKAASEVWPEPARMSPLGSHPVPSFQGEFEFFKMV
ncbi:MAG: adenylate/guanylate cyclase domain-containing protein [Verrucomicrobiae bacterium]|nr:adenylate/guanylate cyclase domain-containing protein [Verrucomicrobiae bacterium]